MQTSWGKSYKIKYIVDIRDKSLKQNSIRHKRKLSGRWKTTSRKY